MMTDNYIFDFGMVLIDFNMPYMTSVYVEDKEDAQLVESVVFDREYWNRLDAGTITDDEVKQQVCARLPERLHELACKVYDNWYKNLLPINGMYDLIDELKAKGKKLYLLSNISNKFAENYSEVQHINDVFSKFDGLVFSAPLGLVKPNREIFDYLLDKYGLEAQDCTFIDDNKDNIAAAESLGINTYLFDVNAEKLREYIKGDM